MPRIKDNNLGYLGVDFQYKLVKCFIEDQPFFCGIQHIVDQNMFTEDALRRIVGFMKDRYMATEAVATYFDIEALVRSKITDTSTIEIMLATLSTIKEMDLGGMDIVENETEKFFKQQNLTKAINESMEIIKNGNSSDYYVIEDIVKKALETNTRQDYGFRVFDFIDSDLREDYRQPIPTGTKELDASLYGGLGKGELGLIVSPMGVGKTSIVTGFAAAAATCQCEANNYNGYKVLHLFHEDPEPAIRRKYFGYVLDIDACTLSDADVRPYAIQRLKEDTSIKTMITNNIRCKRLSTGEVTASQIKEMIKANIARGFKPDMVIIDYFECLKPEKSQSFNENEWSKEAVTMRKLETICNEFQIALWVPVQGTKGSIGENFVGLQHAGGSVAKTQIGHVILTLARTEEQKAQGLINVYIQKLRAVKIGRDKFLNVRFNNGTCKFDMSDMADENAVAFDNQSSQNMAVARDVVNRQRRNV